MARCAARTPAPPNSPGAPVPVKGVQGPGSGRRALSATLMTHPDESTLYGRWPRLRGRARPALVRGLPLDARHPQHPPACARGHESWRGRGRNVEPLGLLWQHRAKSEAGHRSHWPPPTLVDTTSIARGAPAGRPLPPERHNPCPLWYIRRRASLAARRGRAASPPTFRESPEMSGSHGSRLMPSLAIRDSSVVGLSPRTSAAPCGPLTRQPVRSSTERM